MNTHYHNSHINCHLLHKNLSKLATNGTVVHQASGHAKVFYPSVSIFLIFSKI